MTRQLTVRGVPQDVAERLEILSRSRGRSVNSTVLEILKNAVGVHECKKRLARDATWSAEDLAEFERALADQRPIDEELWR
jgi:plasmid stability protein